MAVGPFVGVGLRPLHYPFILEHWPEEIDWFEAISENYMDTRGRPRTILRKVRERYPVALHGVSMSIASAHGVDRDYLRRLRELADEIQPFLVSDHLCWTGTPGNNLHDLLPFPYTEEFLKVVEQNVLRVQDVLGRSMVFENVSSYLSFPDSEMTEHAFLIELCQRTGCRMLLDVNNAWVNACNHAFEAEIFLDAVPQELIAQIHLAGPTDYGDFLFDTHSGEVPEKVWNLFKHLAPKLKNVPVLIEWDENIPDFPILALEASRARGLLET